MKEVFVTMVMRTGDMDVSYMYNYIYKYNSAAYSKQNKIDW